MRRTAVYTTLWAGFIACSPAVVANSSLALANAVSPLSTADQQFLQARDAARAGDVARLSQLARQLEDHPLSAYVEYWKLVPRLRIGEPAVRLAVEDFLSRNYGTYIADRLRLDWSLALADRGDFADFERETGRLTWNADDPELRCYSALARFRGASNSQSGVASSEARRLLANTRDATAGGCLALTEALLADGRISVWDRVRAFVEQNQLAAAKSIGERALDSSGKPVDEKLLTQAIDRPAAFLAAHERRLTKIQRELAIVAITRLARDSPSDAAVYAAALNLHLTPGQRGIVWGRVGHMAALRLMAEANEWYRRGGKHVGVDADATRIDEVLEWQVRAALRAGDWTSVRSTIDRMPAALRADPAWVFWYARALKVDGRPTEAQDQLAQIADQFNFYGQLAAEELGRPIVPPPRASTPTVEELAPLATNAGFVRARKFYDLGLRVEGNREWNWQLRGMADRQLLAAAEYARTQALLDRMINTSDRTRAEHDFAQRFPTPFRETLVKHAARAGLDEAWVYGLIRQESRFIMDLRSQAGASGLMQLMPGTAAYVARKQNVNDYAWERVNERDLNLQLGTAYLRMVLDDLDGNTLLATAAYNAGPGRPRAWRSTLARPVEGAIFAETIPFNETRDYVKKVLSNSVYYAALLQSKPLSLSRQLGIIAPKAAGTTDLP
ncbi:MAG: putative soluble lytic murein transglycosylase [Burkholderiaceae bacterium]|nr:putative soluble lytic murein transglycosylase [Burkholderiaceae bacterium]